jgi:hypothetical protein
MTGTAGKRRHGLHWGGNARVLSVISYGDGVVDKIQLGRSRALPLLRGAALALIAGCNRPLRIYRRSALVRSALVRCAMVRCGRCVLLESSAVVDGVVGSVLVI